MGIIFIISVCSVISTGLGIVISCKVTMGKIKDLEKIVDEHNILIDKMKIIERKANLANIRIDRLRTREKNKRNIRIQKKRNKKIAST